MHSHAQSLCPVGPSPVGRVLAGRRQSLLADGTNREIIKTAIVLAVVHAILALVMKRFTAVSTAHAWGTLAVGLVWAARGKPTLKLACFGAYVAGCDVLWRMTHAVAFWEMGKYVLIAVFLLAIQNQRPVRRTSFPLGYFTLLLPAAFLTVGALDFGLLRRQLSFNLSGPLVLAVSAAYFSRMRLTHNDLQRVLLSFLVPVAAVWMLVATKIATEANITFISDSNSALSGGFGPNQVSSLLGCGAFVAFCVAVFGGHSHDRAIRGGLLVVALLLGTQSALTFSRSGLYLAVASGLSACAFAARDSRRRTTLILSGVVVYLVATYVVAPRINAFTHGQLGKRFADTQTTGRAELMKADLRVWQKHFVLGVGPGMATKARMEYWGNHTLAAHSELTRTLSEHGLLGLIALGWLSWAVYHSVMRIRRVDSRAIVCGLATYGVLLMVSNSMRIALAGLLVGICFADFPIRDLPSGRPTRLRGPVSDAAGQRRHRAAGLPRGFMEPKRVQDYATGGVVA